SEQVRAGMMTENEAKESKFRHIITRSVGFEREVLVDGAAIPVQAGDCYLICSDGLSNYIETHQLAPILTSPFYPAFPPLPAHPALALRPRRSAPARRAAQPPRRRRQHPRDPGSRRQRRRTGRGRHRQREQQRRQERRPTMKERWSPSLPPVRIRRGGAADSAF